MKKLLYIIPGWTDNPRQKPYVQIATIAKKNGYEVIGVKVNWKKPLSLQVFPIPDHAVLFGFSFGAVFARLIAQKYPCKCIILASMTPLHHFKVRMRKKELVDEAGKRFVDDIARNLRPRHRAKKQTTLYGSLEHEKGDILVPNTEHELNPAYIAAVARLLVSR